MSDRGLTHVGRGLLAAWMFGAAALVSAQDRGTAQTSGDTKSESQLEAEEPEARSVFRLGEIVNVLAADPGNPGAPGIGGAIVTRQQAWTFARPSLDQLVNVAPGVSSTIDTNGRRNEADIFVRGFGRWQVPLSVDGVRIYLPADNRLDFARFLTADIAAVQIQKGYASVLDGPGAMGGAINLVTIRPTKPFEIEGGVTGGGRSDFDNSNGYLMVGSRQRLFYVQGSAAYADRDHWTLSNDYQPTTTSLQKTSERLSSDSNDWRVNLKAGFTPRSTDEYVVNFMTQEGAKGAPLNVYNNPPVPANGFWRWPYWNLQNLSFLTNTQITPTTYVKAKVYRNTFQNGLDAYDDITYTLRAANGRFSSPYDDHAYGLGAEFGTTPNTKETIKAALYYRNDNHKEQQTTRPDSPTARFEEPVQEQAQNTWSIALENTFHASATFDVAVGVSYDRHETTKAEEFDTARGGLFEFPKFDREAFNWQAAGIWHYARSADVHASVSDRARFPMIFELFSARMGSATPNPELGPEHARNVEVGWRGDVGRRATLSSAVFLSNIRDLVQNVQLSDNTLQYQNVGTGKFYGVELSADVRPVRALTAGVNYTFLHRTITDKLQPNLQPVGAPTHKAFMYATWRPIDKLRITPNLDVAGDRWSDYVTTPVQAIPFLRVGSYTLLNLDVTYALSRNLELAAGFKNALDDNYELAWGFPQAGRNVYLKTRFVF